MAKIHPDSEKSRVIFASSAEERFYQECRRQLSDAWRIFYSCTLSNIEGSDGMVDNEADFVLYHPSYGVLVVEVKGGRIGFDAEASQFFTLNRHDQKFKIKNPFLQALTWKSRFLRVLREQDIRVPVSHAVCFPNVQDGDIPPSAGIEPEIIITRDRMADLNQSLKELIKKSQPEKYLKFSDVGSNLEKILVGAHFTTKLHIRDYIDSHENRVKDIESLHESLITPVAGSRRLGIEGEAGTGKTMLAMMLATTFRDQGKSILLLTSNPQLNVFIREKAGTGIDVKTYHEFAESFGINLEKPSLDWSGREEDWIQYEAPDRLSKAVSISTMRYDVVLCDEAQDAQPFWWEAIEKCLVENVESRFYIFFDRSQGVFSSGGSDKFIPEQTLPISGPYFPLVHNYRTTAEIAAFARQFRTGGHVLQSHSGRLGYIPEIITYKDAADCKVVLGKLAKQLVREEGLKPEEITLLSARKIDVAESTLKGIHEIGDVHLHHLQGAHGPQPVSDKGKISVSTISAFKGLETNVGVMLNLSEYNLPLNHPLMMSLVYVACTRAKHMLYVLVKEDDSKLEGFRAALARVRATGVMIIDGSGSEQEMTGVVTHYDPERVGFLSVDDRSRRGNVMFFPHDVNEAAIAGLRVGTRLKFRQRQEGTATIAINLQIIAS